MQSVCTLLRHILAYLISSKVLCSGAPWPLPEDAIGPAEDAPGIGTALFMRPRGSLALGAESLRIHSEPLITNLYWGLEPPFGIGTVAFALQVVPPAFCKVMLGFQLVNSPATATLLARA